MPTVTVTIESGLTYEVITRPPGDPPVPVTPPLRRVQITDTEGPTWDWASPMLLVPWRNKGGDWIDNNGAPYATATMTAIVPWLDFEVAALVERLRLDNTGFYVHGTGAGHAPPKFATRQAAANPPKLHVVTDTGTFDCPCVLDTWFTITSNQSQSAWGYLSAPALVRFDLSAITGVVQSATFSLYLTNWYGGPWTFAVDFCDLPELITDPAVQHPERVELGIAATVEIDADLAAHPDVLAYCGFSSKEELDACWQWGGGAPVEYLDWPEYGMKAARLVATPAGSTSYNGRTQTVAAAGVRNVKPWMVASPRQAPTHLFIRYLLRMEDDVPLGVNQGRKLPAASGRLTGYVNGTWGVDYIDPNSEWGIALDVQLPSAANGGAMGVTPYVYDMNNRMNSPLRGQVIPTGVAMVTSHTYTVELEFKMNTRHADGVQWNQDGVLAVWLDGVEVFRDEHRFWRDTEVANILIGECLIMHGGNNAPHAPIHDQLSGWCVSRSYVGPPKRVNHG